MSSFLRKPPARFFVSPDPEGTSQLVKGKTGGAVMDSRKRYVESKGGTTTPGGRPFLYKILDLVQINPAHEQPRLVFNSGGQPIIRWGFRRYSRTFMTAGPRFYGRWFYLGQQMNQFVARPRITGVPTRLGTTYSVPPFIAGPRAIQLGQK